MWGMVSARYAVELVQGYRRLRAFASMRSGHELETICVAKHTLCNDLPAAAAFMAGNISSKRRTSHWCRIHEGQCTPAMEAATAAAAAAAALTRQLKMAMTATCCYVCRLDDICACDQEVSSFKLIPLTSCV